MNVKQELIMALLFASVPEEADKANEAMKIIH